MKKCGGVSSIWISRDISKIGDFEISGIQKRSFGYSSIRANGELGDFLGALRGIKVYFFKIIF